MLCWLPRGLAYFIHAPKTAGNTVQQSIIQAGYNLDHIAVSGHQNGIDRFEITGKTTSSKHQPLKNYYLRDPASTYYWVVINVRQPLQRLVSLYFSPHRWYYLDPISKRYELPSQVSFCEQAFAKLLIAAPAAVDYLDDATPCSNPALVQERRVMTQNLLSSGRLAVIKTEQLAIDFKTAFGFPLTISPRNVSPYREQAQRVLASKAIAQLVASSHHQIDQQLFYS